MSASIDMQTLRHLFISKVNDSKLTKSEAIELGVNGDKFETADKDDNGYVDIVEAILDEDLLKLFGSIVEEEEKLNNEIDEEHEKEEQEKVQDNNGAGTAG